MSRKNTLYRVYEHDKPTQTVLTSQEITQQYGIDVRNLNKYGEYGNRHYMRKYTFIAEYGSPSVIKKDAAAARKWESAREQIMTPTRSYIIAYKYIKDIGDYSVPAMEIIVTASTKKEAERSFEANNPEIRILAIKEKEKAYAAYTVKKNTY